MGGYNGKDPDAVCFSYPFVDVSVPVRSEVNGIPKSLIVFSLFSTSPKTLKE